MLRGREIDTGETALLMEMYDGLLYAQFDRLDHPRAYGWHQVVRREWEFI